MKDPDHENSLVLSVFSGAGTTALAALRLGRRAISIDLNDVCTEEAKGRITRELDDTPSQIAAE
jgi:DNA modification methylase